MFVSELLLLGNFDGLIGNCVSELFRLCRSPDGVESDPVAQLVSDSSSSRSGGLCSFEYGFEVVLTPEGVRVRKILFNKDRKDVGIKKRSSSSLAAIAVGKGEQKKKTGV